MPVRLPDFTESEKALVAAALKERFGTNMPEIKEVETEIRLSPGDRELTDCPALFWIAGECAFVLSKTGDHHFRAMFYYSVRERYSLGREEFDDLGDCVTLLLRLQADQERERAGVKSGTTGQDLKQL
jgi:hypothetical protein